MLIERIEWSGERVALHLFDLDGSHETIMLFPAEALDFLGWLMQEQEKLLQLNEKHLHDIRVQSSKEQVK